MKTETAQQEAEPLIVEKQFFTFAEAPEKMVLESGAVLEAAAGVALWPELKVIRPDK